jgi:LPXTG-site transpeptidase (sortase) family protein
MTENDQQFSTQGVPSKNAADIIRDKVSRLYSDEPSAKQELAEAETIQYRSKHQQFMYELSYSGKDLAAVQTAWHEYYQGLGQEEKLQVWQEFYDSQYAVTGQHPAANDPQTLAKHKLQTVRAISRAVERPKFKDARSLDDVRATIRHKVSAGGKFKAKHHLQSLLFGLGMGSIVLLVFLFGFFNEVVIAPFIQPGRTVAATPVIVNSSNLQISSTPEVLIPKINVEIPTIFSQNSTDESAIENSLEDGVVHYPTTALPGQNGNAAFFGHSSNNIFNKGKYKFAFVLLHALVKGDTFYLTYNSKMYVYKVISRDVVDPSAVGVLGPVDGQIATATLITCDPPGTSLHRLVVVGQQISPDPSVNSAAATIETTYKTSKSLPGNGPNMWSKVTSSMLGKVIMLAVVIGLTVFVIRWLYKTK